VPGFAPDSACMVASLSIWHQHHERAAAEIERRLKQGERMAVAAPALIETYSVLTRLPRPRRLSPSIALALIEDNFVARGTIIALDELVYRAVLRQAIADSISGGQIYDAVIAACARTANVSTLLTFNERHFRRYANQGLAVVIPSLEEA
jgi:predicted nucleic acid-binding protein